MVTLNDLKLRLAEFKQKYKLFMYKAWYKIYYYKNKFIEWLNKIVDKLGRMLKKQKVIPDDTPTN